MDRCKTFNVSKSSLKDHLSGRTKSRKKKPPIMFTKQEECMVIQYIDEMIEVW